MGLFSLSKATWTRRKTLNSNSCILLKKLLDSNLKIPLTYHICYVGSMIQCARVFWDKQYDVLVEILYGLHGWHNRMSTCFLR